jgi:hypothetical protein
MLIMRTALVLLILLQTAPVFSQTAENTGSTLNTETATNFLKIITNKFHKLENNLTNSVDKYLTNLEKQENKLYKKLYKKDSTAAIKIFAAQQAKYKQLKDKLHSADSNATTRKLKEYLPQFDTLKTSLAFLNTGITQNPAISQTLHTATAQLQQFETKMQIANEIKKQLKQRKEQLTQQLQQYGMGKQLMGLNKEVYYYQQQLNEYKDLINNPNKIQQKAIAVLRNSNLYKDFMKKNSFLAQLFKMPENYGTAESIAGLQTHAEVERMITQRMGGGGPNTQQLVQQQMKQAQQQLKTLKDKVNKLGGSSSNMEMPNFKPNTQKTKTFLQRLEYGVNIQTQRSKYLLPATTDIALTAGYKLNDKSVVGIGAAYKMGWGEGIKHIQLSTQGINLRSFVDVKISTKKTWIGGIWITGGYEKNYLKAYNTYLPFTNVQAWQSSGLIGLTKKYTIGKKTHQLQLLWDFLSYQQIPRAEALKFRVGWGL